MRQCLRELLFKTLVLSVKVFDFVSEVASLNVLLQLAALGFHLNQHFHLFERLVNQAEHKSPNHSFLLAEGELHKLDEFGLHRLLPLGAHCAALGLIHVHFPGSDEVLEGVRRSGVFLFEVVLALLVRSFGDAANKGEGGGGPRVVESQREVVEVKIGLLQQLALRGTFFVIVFGEEGRGDGELHCLREVLHE